MPSGQPTGDRITWDDANEKHLLLCILAEVKPAGMNWKGISERFGKGLTSSAASQKYTKIQRRDKDIFGAEGTPTAIPKAKTAARKKPTTSTPSATKRSANGAAKTATIKDEPLDSGDEGNDETMSTPNKKAKMIEYADEEEEQQENYRFAPTPGFDEA